MYVMLTEELFMYMEIFTFEVWQVSIVTQDPDFWSAILHYKVTARLDSENAEYNLRM